MDANSFFLKLRVVLLAASICTASSDVDVYSLASAVDNHYNHLRTLQCEFTETYTGLGTDRTESGTLWLKKPGKMRWEYRSPSEKVFVSDGKTAWFYVPGEQQVRKTEVKKLDDLRSPLGFLLGKTRLEKELHGLSFAPDLTPLIPGNVILRGAPESMADRVSQVLLEITPEYAISRISVQAMDGSTTEYRLSGQKEDIPLLDSMFEFKIPPGAEVIEGSFGQ